MTRSRTTRRAVLKAAPAVAAAMAVPAVALGDDPNQLLEVVTGEAEIARLFARIEQMKVDLDVYLGTFDGCDPAVDVACDAGVEEIDAVGVTMVAIEPRTFWLGENVDPEDGAGVHDAARGVMRGRIRRLVGYPSADHVG